MHVVAWILYSISAMVVAFGLILILMIGGAGTRLIPYLLLAASIPALIGYGFDRLARRRIG